MAFKFEGKEMYLIFFSQCCWSIHSRVLRFGKNAHSKQRKATPTLTLQFHVKFMYMPSTSIYCEPSVFFQYMVWYGPTSETAWMQRKQKNWLKYTDFTELK